MESNKRVTAVEWLHSELDELEITKNKRSLALHLDLRAELFQQAKAMEKEQIIAAYRDGRTDQQTRVPKFYNRSSAIYYTSTYGK